MTRLNPSGAGRRDLFTSAAAVVALAPGFAFPFVSSAALGPRRSDLLLLSTSVALTVVNVVGNAIEANTVSEVGRRIGSGQRPDQASLASYQRRVMRFVLLVTLGLGPVLIALYALRSSQLGAFVTLAAVMLSVPLLGGLASVRSGQVIAYGNVSLAICLQAARSVVPLALVLGWPSVPLVAVPAAFGIGELVRLFILTSCARRLSASGDGAAVELPTNGLWWQSASALTSQAGPVTDRVFLASAPAGSISSYEMADKVFFAAVQLLNLGLLVRRVAAWARLPATEPGAGLRRLRRDVSVLLAVGALVGAAGIVLALVILDLAPLPMAWRQGLVWSAILLGGLPLSLAVMAGGRLLIIARRQDLLLRFALLTAGANALLDAVLYVAIGPIGIPIATVLARLASSFGYFLVVRRLLPSMLGAEFDPARIAATVN